MDEFTCETMESDISVTPEKKPAESKLISTQKKLRRTQDLFDLPSISPEIKTEKSKTSPKKKLCRNLFLPRITDTEKFFPQTPHSVKANRNSLLKKKTALKLLQRKIESNVLNLKKPKTNKVNKFRLNTVLESPSRVCLHTVLSNAANYCKRSDTPVRIRKELYVPLIPLEKTNLLNKKQMKQLRPESVSKSSSCNTPIEKTMKQCQVILERLPLEQMQKNLTLRIPTIIVSEHDANTSTFEPFVTSSPLVPIQLLKSTNSGRMENFLIDNRHNKIDENSFRSFVSLNKSNDSEALRKSSIKEINTTYSLDKDDSRFKSNTTSNGNESYYSCSTNITRRRERPSLLEKAEPLGSSHSTPMSKEEKLNEQNRTDSSISIFGDIKTNHLPSVTPKSALKTGKNKAVSNGTVRRVTFNETSIIIIDDDSDIESGSLRRKSIITPIPTTVFSIDDDTHDEENMDISQFSQCNIAVRTSFPKNTLSITPIKSKGSGTSVKCYSSTPTKTSKVKKVPNFTLLHQKMFDKMLNIEEYSARKMERAKLLLSGHKPKTSSPHNSSKLSKEFNSLSIAESNAPAKQKRPDTPISRGKMNVAQGLTQFGFKSQPVTKTVTKREDAIALAKKTKPLKPTLQNIRTEIKGVRSNRRFELLMQMRLNKK